MKRAGLACVLGLALVGGACMDERITAPVPVAARIRDGEGSVAPQPLFVVDGRIVVEGEGIEIDPEDILDVKVLRGEQAMRVYGARGAHGAVLIATRPAPADAGGPGCWLANGCSDVALPPPRAAAPDARPAAGHCICEPGSLLPGQPLFVIDGQACEKSACGAVSPGDIAAVEVATGPRATALYGTRAARGVVFITTRGAGERR
ncbi:MAG: hypothetical protein ACJ8J0_17680 [Longimicrobiaceae bacterium]